MRASNLTSGLKGASRPRADGVRPACGTVEVLEPRRLFSTTFTVTNDADGGTGSLRWAIEQSNATPGFDVIKFNISGGGLQTISPLTALPAITDPCRVDGYSQPGSHANTEVDGPDDAVVNIQLSGASAQNSRTDGLTITGGGTIVDGLIINRFLGNCISISGAGHNQISGCFLGTNSDGTAGANQFKRTDVNIDNSPFNLIGGVASPDRNLIDDGVYGVHITGSSSIGNCVEGNFIGLDAGGKRTIPNQKYGVFIDGGASRNTVGGFPHKYFNVISGNQCGIEIDTPTSTGNIITDNYIGTDVSGMVPLPNKIGVKVDGAAGNFIGGEVGNLVSGELGNVISGNTTDGVQLTDGATRNVVQNNLIGVGPDAQTKVPNGGNGVAILESPRNFVGVFVPDQPFQVIANNVKEGVLILQSKGNLLERNAVLRNADGIVINQGFANMVGAGGAGNVIAANTGDGVVIKGGAFNKVAANVIGTTDGHTAKNGNGGAGMSIIGSDANTIGGPGAKDGNVISNNDIGVYINDGATKNIIEGNLVGTDSTGSARLGNKNQGVLITGSDNNVIGVPGAGNVIGGNAVGILLNSSDKTKIQANFIGANKAGEKLANTGDGILLSGSSQTTIGGTGAGEANTIWYNGGAGIKMDPARFGVANLFSRNSIYDNAGLGIDFGHGIVPNDSGDPDTGANNLQNYPVLQSAKFAGGVLTIIGTLDSAPNQTFTLEFFSNMQPDPSGFGEGQMYLGTVQVTTNANGKATFTAKFNLQLPAGVWISATATDASNNTSEFSKCLKL